MLLLRGYFCNLLKMNKSYHLFLSAVGAVVLTVIFSPSVAAGTTTIPVILSDNFGVSYSGNANYDIPNWEETGVDSVGGTTMPGGGTYAAPSGTGNDSVSPNGGYFAKIFQNEWMCREVSASGYGALSLSYYWRGDTDAHASDRGIVEYKAGNGSCEDASGWTQLQNYDLSSAASWSTQTAFVLPSELRDTVFRLRFRTDSNAAGQNVWFRVDGVQMTGKLVQTISFTAPNAIVFGTGSLPFDVSARATSALPVTLVVSGPCSVTASNSPATIATATVVPTGFGTCTLTADQAGNTTYDQAPQATHSIVITDKPYIELKGENPMTIYLFQPYEEPGATVYGEGEVPSWDIDPAGITGTVDTSVAGTYSVTYNATDGAGTQAITVVRTVNVVRVNRRARHAEDFDAAQPAPGMPIPPSTPTPSPTPTPSETPTPTPSPSVSTTPEEVNETPTPSPSESETPAPTPSETPTPTPATPTPTPTPVVQTPTPTPTPEVSVIPSPSETPNELTANIGEGFWSRIWHWVTSLF